MHSQGQVLAVAAIGGKVHQLGLPRVGAADGDSVHRGEVVVGAQGAVANTYYEVGPRIGSPYGQPHREGSHAGHVHARPNDHGVVVAVVVAATIHAQRPRRAAEGVAHYLGFVQRVVVVEQLGPAGGYDIVADAIVVEILYQWRLHGATGSSETFACGAAGGPVVGHAAYEQVIMRVCRQTCQRQRVGVHGGDSPVQVDHERAIRIGGRPVHLSRSSGDTGNGHVRRGVGTRQPRTVAAVI